MKRSSLRARRLLAGLALSVGAVAIASFGATADAADARSGKPAKTVDVQILAFNDFHGNLEPPAGSSGRVGTVDAGGVEYLRHPSAQLEATNPRTRTSSPPAT